MKLKGIKKIHFIGICGYIMSAMAVMMQKMGYQISGSDQDAYPPTTEIIDRAKIKRFEKHSPLNVDQTDLVVIGNHIGKDNPEAQAVIKQGLNFISLPELISEVFKNQKRIVVAGTHGKTTTSSLIAWILEIAGLKPSYLIGGVMRNTNQGFKLGRGQVFVVEGDEYRTSFFDHRPKFLHYQPEIAVLTNCELDHPDYFKDLDEVKKTFKQFLKLVPQNGLVVAGIDDKNVAQIVKSIKKPKILYGFNQKADYQAFEINFQEKTKFKVKKGKVFLGEFESQLPGLINIQNSLAGIAVVDYLGVKLEKIQEGVASFKGTNRRFEVIGQPKGITIVDDYAHHPTKIKKTLAAAKTKYPDSKIYCIFEPHTYSRTKTLINDYAQAFNLADEVIITKLMPAREAGQKATITSKQVVRAIKEFNSRVKLIPESLVIIEHLITKIKKGDIILIMSVGGLGGLAKKLVKAISK